MKHFNYGGPRPSSDWGATAYYNGVGRSRSDLDPTRLYVPARLYVCPKLYDKMVILLMGTTLSVLSCSRLELHVLEGVLVIAVAVTG